MCGCLCVWVFVQRPAFSQPNACALLVLRMCWHIHFLCATKLYGHTLELDLTRSQTAETASQPINRLRSTWFATRKSIKCSYFFPRSNLSIVHSPRGTGYPIRHMFHHFANHFYADEFFNVPCTGTLFSFLTKKTNIDYSICNTISPPHHGTAKLNARKGRGIISYKNLHQVFSPPRECVGEFWVIVLCVRKHILIIQWFRARTAHRRIISASTLCLSLALDGQCANDSRK